jgi:transposase-like protein
MKGGHYPNVVCPECGSKRMALLTQWEGNDCDYCCQECFSTFRYELVCVQRRPYAQLEEAGGQTNKALHGDAG